MSTPFFETLRQWAVTPSRPILSPMQVADLWFELNRFWMFEVECRGLTDEQLRDAWRRECPAIEWQ